MRLLIPSILFILINLPIFAQSGFDLDKATIKVHGTSTLHDWTSEVTELDLTGALTFEEGQLKDIQNLKVRIPVQAIKSEKGRTMDNKTYDAFKSEEHPFITYQLKSIQVLKKRGNETVLLSSGTLTMAGSSRNIKMEVIATRLSDDLLRFTGEKELNMTDFNMEPPTALLGTISTGEKVTVEFNVTVKANNEWSNSK